MCRSWGCLKNSVDVIRASYPGTFSHGDTRRVLDGIGFKNGRIALSIRTELGREYRNIFESRITGMAGLFSIWRSNR